jgi:hypothetical protein
MDLLNLDKNLELLENVWLLKYMYILYLLKLIKFLACLSPDQTNSN